MLFSVKNGVTQDERFSVVFCLDLIYLDFKFSVEKMKILVWLKEIESEWSKWNKFIDSFQFIQENLFVMLLFFLSRLCFVDRVFLCIDCVLFSIFKSWIWNTSIELCSASRRNQRRTDQQRWLNRIQSKWIITKSIRICSRYVLILQSLCFRVAHCDFVFIFDAFLVPLDRVRPNSKRYPVFNQPEGFH